MKAYHASNVLFTSFDSNYIETMPGLWFTEDTDYALEYGEYLYEAELNIKHSLDLDSEEGTAVVHEFLKAHPKEKALTTKLFRNYLLRNKYDAMQWTRYGKLTVVVLDEDKIKIVKYPTEMYVENTVA